MADMEAALGVIEVGCIGPGIGTADEMLKKAGVDLVLARPICPGKFIVIIRGGVADVAEAVAGGTAAAGDMLIDSLVLPGPHPDVLEGLLQVTEVGAVEALGIVETFSACSCLEAADRAVKRADVRLIEVRLSIMMAGKCYLTLTGDESAVREAVNEAAAAAGARGQLLSRVVISRPHGDLGRFLV